MNRWELLDSATLADGDELTLQRRADEFSLRVAGFELMNSRQHGSERQLAEFAVEHYRLARQAVRSRGTGGVDSESTAAVDGRAAPSVLVGGLGMGFTLRAALDLLPSEARVTVAELVPQVVDWNRAYLGDLAARPLNDNRVSVVVDDVAVLLRKAKRSFDIVLLDTDNGPEGTTKDDNEWLYSAAGLGAIGTALKPRGVLAIWSAFPSEPFTKRLRQAGFDVDVKHVRSRGKKGNRHVIWVATSK